MKLIEHLNSPGDHPLMLTGLAGQLEAVLTVPDQINSDSIAFLGHPHSLQGGTMNNKVVTTLARTFKELNIPSLRFNFRGVGQSEGTYDEGIGESEDMLALVKQWKKQRSQAQCIFAGFSFGSLVTYRAAAQTPHALLISIAPPVHHYDFTAYHPAPHPWLIIQGIADEVVPASQVLDFARTSYPDIPVIEFPDAGHFFHGALIELKTQLIQFIETKVPL